MPQKKKTGDQTPFEADQDKLEVLEPDYNEKEAQYRNWLLRTLEHDRNVREQPHDEFNGMTYTERYISNFRAGNSYSPPRTNKEDTSVVTGTTREKKLAIMNAVLSLTFETIFRPFDDNNIEDQLLGEAMSDCVFQSNQVEQWDEKKIYVYSELTDQGDVFIEDNWVDEKRLDKKRIKISDLNEEVFNNFDPGKAIKTTFSGARRKPIPGLQVYLGNIREPVLANQPRIFTRSIIPYESAKAIYGHLPRWENVPRNLIPVEGSEIDSYGYNWRLSELDEGMVEVISYQDKFNDEYQILINGVMQLPVGFPMPWEHGEYNIVQGHLEPISAFFAYSKSIPDKTNLEQQVLDEMYRLAVLKTQKSFMPPIANYSANILTKSMFLPGKVNNNLEKGELEVLGGNPNLYAMQQTEFEMIRMVKGFIDEKSVSPALTGQQFKSRTTAAEVEEVTKAAKQQLGVMVFGFMNLHLQLDYLRLMILLENYTKPQGEKLNKLTDKLERKFLTVSTQREIGGRGLGDKRVEFVEEPSDPMELFDQEEGIERDEMGMPVQVNPPQRPIKITQIKPSVLRSVKWRWYPEVSFVERETSLAEKISFEDRITKAMQLFGIESVNQDYAKQQWAAKNKLNPVYFFNPNPPTMPTQEEVDAVEDSAVQKINRSSPTGQREMAKQGIGGAN